jgi:pyrroline-5-carboxylate reductase
LSRFWIIGCGNMAGAMLSRWLEAGMDAANVQVVDPALPSLPGNIVPIADIPEVVDPADTVLIGIKPQMLDAAATDIGRLVGPDTVVLSILAGVESDTLRACFPAARKVVRIIPNLPVVLGKGVVALHAANGPDGAISDLMAPLGLVEWIATEDDFALITALSGSGPAFLYRFVDALGSAAQRLGLDGGQARRMALATVEGASSLAVSSDASPATLADRVASKGGSTREGLDVLDADEALVDLLTRTLDAAKRRNIALGQEATRVS